MNKFLSISLTLSFVAGINATAQVAVDLSAGKKLLEMKQYHGAKSYFRKQIAANPQGAEAFYYLGKALVETGNIDSAKTIFGEGITANPKEGLNYAGMGVVALVKKDKAAAEGYFTQAKELASKKNIQPYLAIADAYLTAAPDDTSNTRTILDILKLAKKYNNKDAYMYFLFGETYLFLAKDATQAMNNYEYSVEANPKFVLNNLRMGNLYIKVKNGNAAYNQYNAAITNDPDYAPNYREIGEFYYETRDYKKARDNYEKYIGMTEFDINAQIRFAQFMFLNGEHENVVAKIKDILKVDTTNNVNYRLLAYSSFETGRFDEGLAAITKFFTRIDTSRIIASDHLYYAKLLNKTGNDSVAIPEFKKAVEMDTTLVEAHAALYDIYLKREMNKEAAEQMMYKIRRSTKVLSTDYYSLGKAYFYSGQYALADSAYKKFVSLNPNFAAASLMRARCYTLIDTTEAKALAKPHYEDFLNKVGKDTVKYRKEIIESYRFMASYYYFGEKNDEMSKSYLEKILAIDPKDEKAKEALKGFKKKP
jgi:tetratricopeptide (TPR) repeat protein